ncbi:MAG TPA: CocE/NonD family hydrolase [Solirubrobacteraceae bacterium]|jgi:hypothetical protein|nr:CocE/NonD family hydrolase [Solirubrobacteraceae bacterium]
MRRHHLAVVLVAALLALAPASAAHAFEARGGIEQAYVLGAQRGERLALLDARGRVVRVARADRLGSRIFRDLAPGRAYRVRRAGGATRGLRVLRAGDDPAPSFYRRKRLRRGLNYVRVRDGIELAMTVRLPPGRTLADGPFATVVEYSGYQVAAPHDLIESLAAGLSGRPVRPDPLAPASGTILGSALAPLLGFAVVSVQMRGSGCSGGDFDLFGLPTTYDGYDAIETVAAQPWVKGGRVGMVGISFSGITQLFTAGTRPPHLEAITPLSVTDDVYAATGYPGGIRNSGFARSWLAERMRDARPAPRGGQPWARALVRSGDRHCRANQRLRLQTQDLLGLLDRNEFRRPRLFDHRSGAAWMGRIAVPTFLVGQFQDEQTGGHFAHSLQRLSANPNVWISLQNGTHVDSLGPSTITRWLEFLKLYVAGEVPSIPESIRSLSGQLYLAIAGAPAAPVEQSRFAGMTDVAAARAAFARDPRVRLLMDSGAGPAGPGSLGAAWELGFDAWPPRELAPTTYYLGPGGALDRRPPAAAGEVAYVADPAARPAQTLPGSGDADAWRAQPPYDWRPVAPGRGLGFATAPLDRDVVLAGPASLDLYLRSSARDTDLQVTLSEVRPDGDETYVQNGWLRASHRRLDRRRSTVLEPVHTHLARDAQPVPARRYTIVRVPIMPVAHAFRAGSRIRVTIQAPGGDRPRWRFSSVDRGRTRNAVGLGGAYASRLVLPVVEGATALGTPLPPPAALRGQPTRRYAAAANGG